VVFAQTGTRERGAYQSRAILHVTGYSGNTEYLDR
jgi:hypothetical protein